MNVIEKSKSDRSKCKYCKKAIALDDLRFGRNTKPIWKDPVYQWFHVKCAAEKHPYELKIYLSRNRKKLPDDVFETMHAASQKQTSPCLPYAVITKNSKQTCTVCDTPIRKGEFLVMINEPGKAKPLPTRSRSRRPATRRRANEAEPEEKAEKVHVHAACASAAAKEILKVTLKDLRSLLKARCPNLTDTQMEDLGKQVK